MPPSTAENTQTIEAPNFSKTFAKFGAVVGFDPKPFEQLAFILAAPQGGGKSSLLADDPYILRLDFDGAKENIPHAKSTRITFDYGQENYPKFLDLVEQLEELSRKDQPRPHFIAFDTANSYLNVANSYVVHEARLKGEKTKAGTDVDTIGDIGYGWARVYDHAGPPVERLAGAGYGLILCTFLEEEVIRKTDASGNELVITRQVASLPPKFWQRIKGLVDYCCGLSISTETEVIWGEPKMRGDKVILDASKQPVREKKGQITTRKRFITFNTNKDKGEDQTRPLETKTRIPMPDVIYLPSVEGDTSMPCPGNFDLLRQAYIESVKQIRSRYLD